jgi:hypothetical protein
MAFRYPLPRPPRDAYVKGCEAKLTLYLGAIEAFAHAIAADPGFALAHVAKTHTLMECGNAAAARESMAKQPIPLPPVLR